MPILPNIKSLFYFFFFKVPNLLDASFYLHKAKITQPTPNLCALNSVLTTSFNIYIESVSAPKTQLHSWSVEEEDDIYFANGFEATVICLQQRQLTKRSPSQNINDVYDRSPARHCNDSTSRDTKVSRIFFHPVAIKPHSQF